MNIRVRFCARFWKHSRHHTEAGGRLGYIETSATLSILHLDFREMRRLLFQFGIFLRIISGLGWNLTLHV